jgi:hypothetical protein
LLAALWMLVFGMPLFFVTPDSPGTHLGAARAIRDGMSRLAVTLRRLGNFRRVGFFLLARLTYNEGFVVLMLFSGVYAATVMHWKPRPSLYWDCATAWPRLWPVCSAVGLTIGSAPAHRDLFVAGSLLATIVVCSTTPTAPSSCGCPTRSRYWEARFRRFPIGCLPLVRWPWRPSLPADWHPAARSWHSCRRPRCSTSSSNLFDVRYCPLCQSARHWSCDLHSRKAEPALPARYFLAVGLVLLLRVRAFGRISVSEHAHDFDLPSLA